MLVLLIVRMKLSWMLISPRVYFKYDMPTLYQIAWQVKNKFEYQQPTFEWTVIDNKPFHFFVEDVNQVSTYFFASNHVKSNVFLGSLLQTLNFSFCTWQLLVIFWWKMWNHGWHNQPTILKVFIKHGMWYQK